MFFMSVFSIGSIVACYYAVITIFLLWILVFVMLPLSLATVTCLRNEFWNNHRRRRRKESSSNTSLSSSSTTTNSSKSCLYVGRVYHTRFKPVVHKFQYPLIIFGLDLEEMEDNRSKLWPLSVLMKFFECDHLKNGEGMIKDENENNNDENNENNKKTSKSNLLLDRIFRLVSERTNGKFVPSRTTHSCFLVTHLRYYGYCFNPVSFYYVIEKGNGKDESSSNQSNKVAAVIGEVSNTPWNEMHCYVLHPDSVQEDNVQVQILIDDDGQDDNESDNTTSSNTNNSKLNYVFPKVFHVSPFMEMTYNYDWTFQQYFNNDNNNNESNDRLVITNSLVSKTTGNDDNNDDDNDNKKGQLQFHARMDVKRTVPLFSFDDGSSHTTIPFQLAHHILIRFPIYCLIVQVWIHYEAFWLFYKGVAYQPHPNDTETTASLIIGTIMTPFFAVQDMIAQSNKKKEKEE